MTSDIVSVEIGRSTWQGPAEDAPRRAGMARHPQKPREGKMTSDANLLPCPFCGGPAEIIEIDDGENAGGSCVCCTKCMASGNIEFGRKENFVSNWNTRVPHPAPVTAQEAEPVAWQLKDTKVGTIAYTSNKERANRCRGISGFVVTPMFAHPPQPSETVTEALKLAAARLQRLALEIPSTTPLRADAFEWADEALRALKGGSNG